VSSRNHHPVAPQDRVIDARLVAGLALIVALVIVNAGIAYRNVVELHEAAAQVARTQQVLEALDTLLSAVTDAETGQRGFLITGDERYLEPYDVALFALEAKLTEARQLTRDNPTQQARIPRLQELCRTKLEELATTIALRRASGFEAAQKEVLNHLGKNRMDAIRALVSEMQEDERARLREREQTSHRAYQVALVSGFIAALLALAAVATFFWLLRRHLTARVQAAAVLGQQRKWFRTTLSSIGDAVLATDSEGRITFANAVAEALTGWTDAEARGQPLEIVFRIVSEETGAPAENPVAHVIAEGGVVGLASRTLLIARDGAKIPIDDSAAPILDEEGKLTGVVLVFRDISARRREEQARRQRASELAEAANRLAAVVDTIVDGIITIDERGLMESMNPAAERLFGYASEEIAGRNVRMLMPDPYRSEHDGYIAKYVHTGQAKIIGIGREVTGLRKDGSTFPMELAVSEFRVGGNRHFTGIVRDITERKRAEKQIYETLIELKEADRRKDEFLAMLAHEVRGPLAPLSHALEIMKRGDGDAALRAQLREAMERQLGQLVRLVDDLLDASRISRGKLELRKERVELESAVRIAVEACRPLLEGRRHELTVNLPSERIRLDADPARVAQILGNILNNACKYTEPGGSISLVAERQADHIVLSVKDNGIGIPPDMIPHIFGMFTQLDESKERAEGGLGIGLAVAKQLAELHGGTIGASSDGAGRGSEFVVRLPIVIDHDEMEPARAETAVATPAQSHRILVADDNQDSARSLALLLKLGGNDTHAAFDGLQAIEAAAWFRPHVMLLDVGMPRLNGYDAARHVREQPWGRDVLLVALTGWGQEQDVRKSKEAGFDHHLVKPVDYDALTRILSSLAASRRPN
jgi:PAS domain S-box-containing protein